MEILTRTWCLEHMADWLLTEGPPGFVVEVGVYQGGSLAYLAERLPTRWLYGYDNFAGLVGACDKDTMHRDGDLVCSEDVTRRNLSSFRNVVIITGLYPHSDFRPPVPVALAHVDVDLYHPTLAALRHLWPLLAPGGRVYAGDAYWQGTPGATVAWEYFCVEVGVQPQQATAPPHADRPWYDHPVPAPLAFAEKPR